MIKVIFFGTNTESVPALMELLKNKNISVVAGVTSKPKPANRQMKISDGPVLSELKKNNIPAFFDTTENLEDKIANFAPDVNVVVSFGHILSSEIIHSARVGTVNIHPSLLPKFRGPSPVPYTILSGEKTTGVTIIEMDEKMDHGPILDVSEISLEGDENTPDLLLRLMTIGSKRVVDVLEKYANNEISKTPQNHTNASFTKLFTRDSGRISSDTDNVIAERMVRAFAPWPGTWTEANINERWTRVKILKSHLSEKNGESDVIQERNGELTLGSLILDTIQFEGKTSVSGNEFARTHKLFKAQIR